MKKKRIIFLLLTLFPLHLPLYSLTWHEFLETLSPDKYDFPINAKNKNVTCWKKVYWEEYIEGDSYTSGYVKKYRKEIKIDCPY